MTTNIENIENRENRMVQHSQFNGNVETGKELGYHPDGCLQPISLTDDETIVNLKGYTVSVAELREHVIDSIMYRKHLRELRESQ